MKNLTYLFITEPLIKRIISRCGQRKNLKQKKHIGTVPARGICWSHDRIRWFFGQYPFCPFCSLRTKDVSPVVTPVTLFFGGREATTGNTSAVRRLPFCRHYEFIKDLFTWS